MRHVLARFGITTPATAAKAATIPMCAVCAGYPLVTAPLLAVGVISSAAFLHLLIPVLAPLNLWLLRAGWREHGQAAGLILAVASLPFILAHMVGHLFLGGGDFVLLPLIWAGGGLLVAAILVDRRAQRFAGSCATPEAYWRAVLTGTHPGLRRGRHLLARLPANPRCRLCNAPFSPPFGVLMHLIGKGPSAKNPHFCGDCISKTPIGGAEVEVSLLFADVRGSTTLAEALRPIEFAAEMNRFYVAGTAALTRTDALIDKFMGDEVIGLYTPGFAGEDHARRAVDGAQQLLRAHDPGRPSLPIGIGVHTAIAYVGTVGSEGGVSDMTVLGDAANVAARLASAAGPGEILITAAACTAAGLDLDGLECRTLQLKGRSEAVVVRVLHADTPRPTPLTLFR